MPAILVTGPTVMQDSQWWPEPRLVLTLAYPRRDVQAESTWVPGSVPGWFTGPKRSPIQELTGPDVELS